MGYEILPSNRTALEQAYHDTGARIGDIPLLISSFIRPRKTPASFLPWMAWGHSVDLWRDDWPEGFKRVMIDQSITHHRQKGTLASLRRAARMGGAEIIDTVLPSRKAFAGVSMTEAEREAFLARYPELRVYRHRDRGKRSGAMPTGGTLSVKAKMFLGGGPAHGTAFPAMSKALQRSLPRVFRVAQDGTETELTTAILRRGTRTVETVRIEQTEAQRGRVTTELGGETIFQIVGRALVGAGAMCGDPSLADQPPGSRLFLGAGRYLADKRAHKRTYITRFNDVLEMPDADPELLRSRVQPLLDRQRSGIDISLTEGDVMTARAELVEEPGQRVGMFPSRAFMGRSHLFDHDPGRRMYMRSRIYDPSVSLPSRSGMFYCGVTRLGMDAFHAELKVRIRGRKPSRALGRYVWGYPVKSESPFAGGLTHALRTSASLRDKILLNTKTAEPIMAGGEITAGQPVLAGSWSAEQ